MSAPKSIKLNIPEQDLTQLTFCDANVRSLQAWVDGLPMTNIGETSKRLYHAIIELNRLHLTPQVRYQLLELLRPSIYFICRALGKHYLQQPVVMPEKPLKIANLAQALQSHLAAGYKIAIAQGLELSNSEKHRKLLTFCIHRAISDLGRTIVRAYQLYRPTPANTWTEIHQLYLLAESKGLLNYKVIDKPNSKLENSTIEDAYLRICLLGTAKPNQIRQQELLKAYDALEFWVDQVKVCAPDEKHALFVALLAEDCPPIYRIKANSSNKDTQRGIETQHLVDLLNRQSSLPEKTDEFFIQIPNDIGPNLLQHLTISWGRMTERGFARAPAQGTMELLIGLASVHFHLAGERTLHEQLGQDVETVVLGGTENPFLHGRSQQSGVGNGTDAWSSAFDAGGGKMPSLGDVGMGSINFMPNQVAEEERERIRKHQAPIHVIETLDTSPGGYCLRWSSDVPLKAQSGEIIALRENQHQGWSIAVVRWIRHINNKGTMMGVELLAPSASPCAIRLIQKSGSMSEFLHALLLPELAAIGKPMSIIAPRLPFRVGNKVMVNLAGKTSQYQLNKRLTATASFNQFQLKSTSSNINIDKPNTTKSSSPLGDDFDSLWPNL
ncbi:GTPase [Litoribrevibacter euphylliae]|uniref:GTPase n=1 Tax=Litoribrevibacter euphylliae TaxID=1834034 RepID=A0ABV7HDK8_9GAMM